MRKVTTEFPAVPPTVWAALACPVRHGAETSPGSRCLPRHNENRKGAPAAGNGICETFRFTPPGAAAAGACAGAPGRAACCAIALDPMATIMKRTTVRLRGYRFDTGFSYLRVGFEDAPALTHSALNVLAGSFATSCFSRISFVALPGSVMCRAKCAG